MSAEYHLNVRSVGENLSSLLETSPAYSVALVCATVVRALTNLRNEALWNGDAVAD